MQCTRVDCGAICRARYNRLRHVGVLQLAKETQLDPTPWQCTVTPSSQCSSFWQRTKFQPSHSHSILQILLHLSSGSSRVLRCGSKIFFHGENSTEHDSRPQSHTRWELPEALPAMVGLLEQVCMAEGQSFKGDSVSFYYISFLFRIMPEFQELFHPPTIYIHTVSCLNCHVTCPFTHKRNCGGVIRASNGKQGWQDIRIMKVLSNITLHYNQ